ncbi:MAG TPA: hypothetical protein DCX53_10005, partial [Anaerolineae bacterium]|nr:hypothetical protein [Anaerolineae bacterium]
MNRKITILIILIMSISQLGWIHAHQQARPLRVCAYENAPKIYTNENGIVTGFWPELLNYIAVQEGWDITWVPGAWEDCLTMLGNNEIDILPDTGWTEERSRMYAFSEETVLISWTRMYAPAGSDITSILDLEGKSIAGLRGSFNLDGPEGIKELTDQFGVHSTFIEMDNYTQVFEALENGDVDAGITNKDFGNLNESKYDVVRTPILFQPARILFAFPMDGAQTSYLIERIDNRILDLKADDNSIYYQALDNYLGEKASGLNEQEIPDWVKNLGIFAGGVIIFLLAVGFSSQTQVKRRTAELQKNQEQLRTIMDSVEYQQAAAQNEFQANLLKQINDAIIAVDNNFRITAWNQAAEKLYG